MSSLLEIFKASAGSGKTHLLTVKYLTLLLQNPVAYRQILAVTFTNKATAEMKERILQELGKLARHEATTMGKQLMDAGVADSLPDIYEKASAVYTSILHDYSRFSVSTIDAFTQKLIRSCSWELGLDSAFNLQLKTETVRNDLAEKLFEKIDTPGYEALRRQMADLAAERVDEGKSWNFKEDLVKMADMLFSEAYLAFDALLAREQPDPDAAIKALHQEVFERISRVEKGWKEMALRGQALMEGFGLTPDDFSNKERGFGGRFDAALKRGFENPRDNSYTKKILDGEGQPFAKTTPAALKDRITTAMPTLLQVVNEMVGFYETEMPAYQTALSIKDNLNYLRLVLLMGKELAAWRKENNALLISDTHNLLRQLSAETTPEFIYEKTGNRLRHFLMDEFQDTSDFQYHNFKPLLRNSMGQGAYNLVVGDVKQAIYRWRNGDWRLLHSRLPEDFSNFKPAQHTLDFNYRSAKPVIQFNNYFFSLVPGLLQQHITTLVNNAPDSVREPMLAQYATLLTDAYADARQEIPETAPDAGLVEVKFINMHEVPEEGEDEDDYNSRVLREVHGAIKAMLKQGYQPGDIAILCRSNKQAKLTIETLMLWQQEETDGGYPLLSAEALLISSNGAVQLIVAAMQWLLDDKNRLAETLLRQFYARKQGMDGNRVEVFLQRSSGGEGLPVGLFQQRARLRMLPMADLANELIALLGLQDAAEDIPYLLAFQDLVQEWTRFSDEGMDAFLQYWKEEGSGVSLPAATESNAVEVVTIHKAKGLAYTVVLMPFCNWMLEPDSKMKVTLWADMRQTSFPQMPMLPVYYTAALAGSELAPFFFEELVNSYMDNLNLLYVALTRARSRLMLWAPLPIDKKGEYQHGKLKYIHHLLYAAAVHHPECDAEDAALPANFDQETEYWKYGQEPSPEIKMDKGGKIQPGFVFESWRLQRQTVMRWLDAAAGQDVPVLARRKGIVLHEIMGKLTQPTRLQKVLREMEASGKITTSHLLEYKKVISDVLALAPFDGWDQGVFYRLAERAMLIEDGTIRRPDLVLYNEEETRVIDFKFTDIKEKAHTEQVQAYMRWLSSMGFAGVKGFLIYGFGAEAVPVST